MLHLVHRILAVVILTVCILAVRSGAFTTLHIHSHRRIAPQSRASSSTGIAQSANARESPTTTTSSSVPSTQTDFSSSVKHTNVQTANKPDQTTTSAHHDDHATAVRSRPKPLSAWTGVQFVLASLFGQTPHFLTNLMYQHGDCVMIWNRYVILNNKDAIRDVLETHNLEKTPEVKRGYRSIFYKRGGILAASPLAAWKRQRRMIAPVMQQPKVIYEALLPKFAMVAKPVFDLIEARVVDTRSTDKTQTAVVDMDQAFTALTLDTIGLVLLGKTFHAGNRLLQGETSNVPFVKAMNALTLEALRQMILPSKLLQMFQPSHQVQEAKVLVDDFLNECVSERIVQRHEGRANQTDMMNILLDAEEEGAIRRDDTKGQLLTFIFAGHDTTAHTLSWLLYEVSLNDELQDSLYREAKAALPDRDEYVTSPEVLEQFPLLDRVWKEANRKHPAAANGTLRKVGKAPISVGNGLELPAKASVLIPPFSLHRNEAYWPNPEVFDPSRFTDEMEAKRDPMTFQAFSGGPRNCIGSKLARAEAICVLAPLFRRWKVECLEQAVPADFCSLTRRPRDGIRFSFIRRE